jgi:hypothetical protein
MLEASRVGNSSMPIDIKRVVGLAEVSRNTSIILTYWLIAFILA